MTLQRRCTKQNVMRNFPMDKRHLVAVCIDCEEQIRVKGKAGGCHGIASLQQPLKALPFALNSPPRSQIPNIKHLPMRSPRGGIRGANVLRRSHCKLAVMCLPCKAPGSCQG